MLTKQVIFRGVDGAGNIACLPLVGRGLEKVASAQINSKLHPKVKDFVGLVRPTAHGIYVLVSALGAAEYWGQNVNGDIFREKALIHAPSDWDNLSLEQMKSIGSRWDYGFPTFMAAGAYKHHQNKDPSRAFGSVELATWNPQMHRVELIIYLDRALCTQFGAYDVIERIERGEFPDVSMGTRVPFDVCSICRHQSKTTADYCDCAKYSMNKILPDGRKVGVDNLTPKFFDISFVFIGADKTAKVLAKLAQKGNQVCMGDYCTAPRLSSDIGDTFSKTANDPIKKSLTFGGLPIGLEWLKGETREYKSKQTGKVNFSKLMKADYGYIKKTEDNDGEELDVYIGPNSASEKVFVIKQLKDDGSFDENKVMLGYDSLKEAKSSYLDHMPPRRLGAVEELTLEKFKKTHHKKALEMAKEAGSCGCHGLGDDCGGNWDKLAEVLFPGVSAKIASHKKQSEIIKSVPAGPFTKEMLPKLEKPEQAIPPEDLDAMTNRALVQLFLWRR